jgi:hypothetical protein
MQTSFLKSIEVTLVNNMTIVDYTDGVAIRFAQVAIPVCGRAIKSFKRDVVQINGTAGKRTDKVAIV